MEAKKIAYVDNSATNADISKSLKPILTNKSKKIQEIYDNVMFPKRNEAGYVALSVFDQGKYRQKMIPVEEWTKHAALVDCYLSINTFYRPQRDIRSAWHLNAFFVDIDYYKYGVSLDDVLTAIHHHVKYERIYEPTFIISSGRGVYVIWKIEDAPAQHESTQRLYGHIQDYIIKLFEDVGADRDAKDISRILRVPGTINSKNGKAVQFLEVHTENIYEMNMFREYVDPFEEYRDYKHKKAVKKASKNATSKRGKVKHLFTDYSRHIARCADFERLCELRGYKMTGYRNMLLHAYAWSLMNSGKNEKEALDRTLALNNKFSDPKDDRKIKDVVRTVARRYEDHKKDRRKGYNYKKETLIENLNITAEEQREMETLISTRVKYDRYNAKRTPRNEDGLTPRQADKQYLIERVKQLKERGYKQKEIAEMLEINKSTVSKYLKL